METDEIRKDCKVDKLLQQCLGCFISTINYTVLYSPPQRATPCLEPCLALCNIYGQFPRDGESNLLFSRQGIGRPLQQSDE
jgi:hypothetical protein